MDRKLILWNKDLEVFDVEGLYLEINGVKYSYGLFQKLGMSGLKEGSVIKILKKDEDGGLITCKTLDINKLQELEKQTTQKAWVGVDYGGFIILQTEDKYSSEDNLLDDKVCLKVKQNVEFICECKKFFMEENKQNTDSIQK